MFAKTPRTGVVKTRLAPALAPGAAARLVGAFIGDLAERIGALQGPLGATAIVCYTPPDAANEIGALTGGLRCLAQRGCDLGERLASAVRDLRDGGFEQIVFIGSDAPTLPDTTIERAFAALENADVAIAAADDGGYVLLALGGLHVVLFEDIPWSTSAVYAVTLERARRAGLEIVELSGWWDVDDGASFERLRRELAASDASPAVPRTRTFLEALAHAGPFTHGASAAASVVHQVAGRRIGTVPNCAAIEGGEDFAE